MDVFVKSNRTQGEIKVIEGTKGIPEVLKTGINIIRGVYVMPVYVS
jgi:hypothetical protein